MTSDDVKRVFKIFDDDIIILPCTATVSINNFAIRFALAPSNPTYEDLMQIDAGEKGYKDFFDKCKADGILVSLSE